MSFVARSAALTQVRASNVLVGRSARQMRAMHVDNVVGENMPFKYTANKVAYGTKLAVFLVAGFSIPFVAAFYQRMKKAPPSA